MGYFCVFHIISLFESPELSSGVFWNVRDQQIKKSKQTTNPIVSNT